MKPGIWDYFIDPVLQAPTLGSILMCLSSAVVGVIVFLRRRSLLGEALCHAAYPGVVLSAIVCSFWFSFVSDASAFVTLAGAFVTACLGLIIIERMEMRFGVKADTALCFVLAFSFGIGVLCASRIQFTHVLWYKAAQLFLYGQAATMVGVHVAIYAALALLIVCILLFLFHPIRMILFDRVFAKSCGVPLKTIEGLLSILLVLAIVVGIRSVGVVLMAGMLIAPAIAARQLTSRLSFVFIYAGCIGALSGFLGNYLSVEIPYLASAEQRPHFSLPTGPMILLSSALICFAALLFSPRNGLFVRLLRIFLFRRQCAEENVLKYLWRLEGDKKSTFYSLLCAQNLSFLRGVFLLLRLKRQGWIESSAIRLTKEGTLRAAKIVRLHRLWEAYLVFLGQGVEKVHPSAEEMEHIIDADLEQKLTEILGDPQKDPHAQPIPPSTIPSSGGML